MSFPHNQCLHWMHSEVAWYQVSSRTKVLEVLLSIFIMINHIISWIQTDLFFCLRFRFCPIIIGWLRGWRMWIIFKWQKFSLRVLLSFCLIFCQFQPDVAYKSVAYKKKRELACACVFIEKNIARKNRSVFPW